MHHYRLTLNGPPRAVDRLASELAAAGAESGVREREIFLASEAPVDLAALCRRHRAVAVGVEAFESLREEVVSTVVRGGEATELDRRTLGRELVELREAMVRAVGHEIPGNVLDGEALRAAARKVARVRVDSLFSTGIEGMLLLGAALGRLCDHVPDPFEDPTPEALDAVRELAAVALGAGTAFTAHGTHAEFAFERALRLTRACVYAGCEPLRDEPGRADWLYWITILLGSASLPLDTGAESELNCIATPPDISDAEHIPTPAEDCDAALGGLLSTCLQALALFDMR
jgi:hypothetical protein